MILDSSTIPIQNIYYLLCYAWNKLRESDVVAVQPVDRMSMEDLFARVLTNGVAYLVKRGLDRGYVSHSADTCRIRGKIDFNETLQRNFCVGPDLSCHFDELSYDVIHNRIIKTTMYRLITLCELDSSVERDLIDAYRRLGDISTVPLSKQLFRLVQLHSNNNFYDFLLKVCELINDNLLISECQGKSRFRDFVRDEREMRYLFEEFVRNFFRREQSTYQVSRETIRWDATPLNEASADLLPVMNTDISLRSKDRVLIIEAKFYQDALQIHYDTKKITSTNLYQLFAYLKNHRCNRESGCCDGVLLYPTVQKELDLEYSIQGHRVSIRTINLAQDWRNIHDRLLDIIALN